MMMIVVVDVADAVAVVMCLPKHTNIAGINNFNNLLSN